MKSGSGLKSSRKCANSSFHRKRMSRFRGRRAVEKKNMHEEFHRLLEQRLVNLRCSSVCGGPERITKVQRQLQQLVLEREWFRSESETLRQNLARVRNFTQVFQRWHEQVAYAANRERDNNFTTDIDIQTLQRFDEDPYVIVRNYSGGFNFWYLCLVQQAKLEILEGKRILKRYATIGDSKANARSRDAESTSHDDVQWAIEEGSHSLTLVEADESSVDVVFDSLGCFKREVQALEYFIVFGHIVMRWDQQLSPSNLLNSTQLGSLFQSSKATEK
ncbi:hypothetical protein F441_16846 [Phytophthora nicotianae CJ01A1]|uniref:Uncharacterized protein n=1 Tax=Phytophthora nicotianae CJ01A1 TaxID=1317063 RepID=W2W8F6_PHYNI|nr:hypothetical protein F441_16846 [Phytophthora nicotianae CJ01A1]